MNALDVIRQTQAVSMTVVQSYLSDLSDQDLMARPGVGCNHLAWQIGHLISSECSLIDSVRAGRAPKLPDGFAEAHGKSQANNDDPASFCTKQQYLQLWSQVQAATGALLDSLTEADLDAPAPEQWRAMFPTMGSILILIATHPLMHAGQWVPVRRALGKPVVI